jgi:hypothetical protein
MKIEFHPDFHFRIDLKVIWPRIAGAFKGLKFSPDNYRQMMSKIARPLSWILVALVLVIVLIKIL